MAGSGSYQDSRTVDGAVTAGPREKQVSTGFRALEPWSPGTSFMWSIAPTILVLVGMFAASAQESGMPLSPLITWRSNPTTRAWHVACKLKRSGRFYLPFRPGKGLLHVCRRRSQLPAI
jgi:hypothetical protein